MTVETVNASSGGPHQVCAIHQISEAKIYILTNSGQGKNWAKLGPLLPTRTKIDSVLYLSVNNRVIVYLYIQTYE